MKERSNIILFYASLALIAVAATVHIVFDPPVDMMDWISNIAFVGAVGFLITVTVFIFRPQMQRIASNITLMNATMAQMQLLKTVAIAANEAESINEGLQIAVDTICGYTHWQVGHVYLHSVEKDTLVSTGVWHLEHPERCAAFKQVTEAAELSPHQSFVGEVYTDSTPMWILDVADSTVHTRKEAAVKCGLKAAFAFPIFVGRKAVAVMEFYSYESIIPSEELLSVMANIGKQLGQTIERAHFHEKAKLLETVIESANDAIIITKADLSEPGPEIVYTNEAFTRMSGYSREEVIGKSPRILQNEFTKRETLDALKQALLEGKTFKDELLNTSKDGTHYWLEVSIVPVRNSKGVITHFAAIERDITARKQEEIEYKNMWVQLKRANMKSEAAARDLEESLRKAEEANKAKSDFLANMSHELRTPMNGVLGMAHLLADTSLDVEQKELVGTINNSAEGLLMLLNDILDFSKIEAGALVLESIPYNPQEVMHQTAQLLMPNADAKHIQLLMDIERDIPPFIMGDSGRIRQVITNLIGNSIKFTHTGYVRLSARMMEYKEEQRLHVRVEDTGIGIPSNKLGEIFEKFTQADASVTRKYGGTGLGLAITKQLITLMGGDIGVESAEGKGSTFWFSIPCNIANVCEVDFQQTASEITNLTLPRIPIAEAKALLVEDYPVNQLFAQKLLKKFGFTQIDLAENGAEALKKYRTKAYDIIFMDCQMPEMDGYQATGKIRQIEQDTPLHTPIVAMTANAMMGDREKCLKAGMDDYVSKPLRAEHVKRVLETWFVLDEDKATITPVRNAPPVKNVEDPPVDKEQLNMFTNGDPEEEKALFDLFLDQAQAMIDILQTSIDETTHDSWKSAAHRFKGSSGNLGAMRLHHLCKRAEMHYSDPEIKKLEMLAAIKAETARVKAFCYP